MKNILYSIISMLDKIANAILSQKHIILTGVTLSACFSCNKKVNEHSLEGYQIVPIICDFSTPSYAKNNFGTIVEVNCELPDTSIWLICNGKFKKVTCNRADNDLHTEIIVNNCKKEFIVLSKDKKIATRIPFYDNYNFVKIGLGENADDFLFKNKHYFFVKYK
ncbi:MAG TPA: hypothetical protein VK168_13075 [Saprospiraceae bacterium]|nr:hypothetical protein [Saprospiraceae bacterium]